MAEKWIYILEHNEEDSEVSDEFETRDAAINEGETFAVECGLTSFFVAAVDVGSGRGEDGESRYYDLTEIEVDERLKSTTEANRLSLINDLF